MMEKAIQRDLFFEETANIFKIMASPIRLRLIHYISFGPRTVEECSEKLNISIQNASLHLIHLSKAGVLEVEKIKNYRYYSINNGPIVEVVMEAMKSDSRDIMPEGRRFKGNIKELIQQINAEKALLVDLRDDHESRYIPVKRSIPFRGKNSQLKVFLKELPEIPIIFFCKGRLCERLAGVVEEAGKLKREATALCLTASELQEFSSEIH